jgi:putative OPT family oligopeptide transporter
MDPANPPSPAVADLSEAKRPELTLRGLIIGVIITLVFTAANVYFGLKAGLTFSTSIPAAVISMAILRNFRNATVQENNIVQTVASAAGTLSSIIFVLPGLIMIGWWTEFPFWISFLICALGGILGVMYSIPLRRALVTNSDLPYPEGVACAEVLKIGSGDKAHAADVEHSRAGLLAVLWGSIVSAVFAIIVATQIFAADVAQTFRIGKRGAVSGYDFLLSFALLGIGHLVGLSVGIAMLVGALIGWGWGVPHYSELTGDLTGAAAAIARATWSTKVRFIGAGAIGVSAIWTLLKLIKPVVSGLAGAMAANRARKAGQAHTLPITERDFPIGIVAIVTLVKRPRQPPAHPYDRRRFLCRPDELLCFRRLRLHGGTDRFLEQPALGHRHSCRDRRGVAPCFWCEAVCLAGSGQGADRLRSLHHRCHIQRGSDRE